MTTKLLKKRALEIFTVISVLLLSTSPALADIELVFGTYAADKPSTTVKKFKPFLDHLAVEVEARLQEPVIIKMKIAKEYEQSIDDLTGGKVDFARFGPASYITAKRINPDIQRIAMEQKSGRKRFNGVIVVHENSEISSLSELQGHTFAFGDELSTIGRYLSQSHLISAGITGDQLLGFSFLGRHDLVGAGVSDKRFDAGALKESTFKSLISNGKPLRVLFEFGNVTKPWLASADLPFRIANAMRDVMLNIADFEVLNSISKDGFISGKDEEYDFVRAAMQNSRKF